MMTRTLSHRRIHRHAHPLKTSSHKRKASSFKFQISSFGKTDVAGKEKAPNLQSAFSNGGPCKALFTE
jgi:hypothetical protein